ncbi:hypothetical protein ACFOWU_01955 [Epilithonimonas zeae]|uniref:TonB-dependent receptor plug domain-containing protein n=1 Tax=Epilithonimonas zeae TaxID=1416779 RepID=A0A1N6E9Z1_9FLAO|nr:hypothetical protein [Epilithonimonas zeae]SIN79832.1 hypothetical protein SAMN05444409_0410 [Epilithonimonas zeae]
MKVVLLFILFSNFLFAQNKFDSLTSKIKNLEWMRNLKNTENKGEKIQLIIKKIKTDSIVPQNLISNDLVLRDGEDFSNKCKILFFLENNKHLILFDLNKQPNFSIILNVLNQNTVKEINLLNIEDATKSYGGRGGCGAIILHSDKSKLSKQIGELQKKIKKGRKKKDF